MANAIVLEFRSAMLESFRGFGFARDTNVSLIRQYPDVDHYVFWRIRAWCADTMDVDIWVGSHSYELDKLIFAEDAERGCDYSQWSGTFQSLLRTSGVTLGRPCLAPKVDGHAELFFQMRNEVEARCIAETAAEIFERCLAPKLATMTSTDAMVQAMGDRRGWARGEGWLEWAPKVWRGEVDARKQWFCVDGVQMPVPPSRAELVAQLAREKEEKRKAKSRRQK